MNRGKRSRPAVRGRFGRSWSAGKRRASRQASQPFQPSPYLSSLITSINDGAKAAQTGALFFAFIGLYLLAVAFSTTDEDLLRERTVAIAQLGMAVPVVFSFGVAPLIFLFLHIHTLIRYDMLAANLRQFKAELESIPREEDRERCRHLLANVEFLRQLGAMPGTHLASRVFRFVSWFMIAFFPVMVLLIIQLSALRYQDSGMVLAQQVALFADLGFLVWFFHRQWRMRQNGAAISRWRARAHIGRSILFWLAPIVVFNVAYMGVPSPRATIVGLDALRRFAERERGERFLLGRMLAEQPVDLLLCDGLGFGCRYLRVAQTLLLAASADPKVLARLRTEEGKPLIEDIKSIEGLNLRNRSLRFIDLSESRLYAADLTGVDLRWAILKLTSLKGSALNEAQLQGANLQEAKLQGADLGWAQLQGADLWGAHLQGADLHSAQLQGADLGNAQLQGADLSGAQLQGADLSGAQLQGTNLTAYFISTGLQGADLREARLQGADLRGARLQGADLRGARLQGADLRGAKLWQTALGKEPDSGLASNLSLADLREVTFDEPTDEERKGMLASLDAIPSEGRRKDAKERVERALTPQSPPPFSLPKVRVAQPILVNHPDDPRWSTIDAAEKTADVVEYDRLLAPFLFDGAKQSPELAASIARRVIGVFRLENDRTIYPDLARRLLDGRKDGTIRLPDDVAAKLEPIAARYKPAEAGGPKR